MSEMSVDEEEEEGSFLSDMRVDEEEEEGEM
jgi:hypothetical protein